MSGRRSTPSLPNSSDYFQLDRNRCRQSRDLDCCPGRVWLGLAGEIFRVNAVVDGKILFHVSEKDRDVDDVLPRRAGVFEHEPDILEYCAALCFDVVADNVPGEIKGDTGNLFTAAHTRPDPRQKQQSARALCVRERPYRFGRPLAFEAFVHRLFTAHYLDQATFIFD